MLCYLLTHVMTTFDSVYEKDAVQEKPVVFTTRISPTMISPVPLLYSETVSDMKWLEKNCFTHTKLQFFSMYFYLFSRRNETGRGTVEKFPGGADICQRQADQPHREEESHVSLVS